MSRRRLAALRSLILRARPAAAQRFAVARNRGGDGGGRGAARAFAPLLPGPDTWIDPDTGRAEPFWPGHGFEVDNLLWRRGRGFADDADIIAAARKRQDQDTA